MSGVLKNQATNMYINWNYDDDSYKYLVSDWYCEQDTSGTYWAVHNFEGGYSGFIHGNNTHRVLFAYWNSGNSITEIEYLSPLSDASNLLFDNEDVGKHIFNDYDWSTNTWYTLAIGAKTIANKTLFAHWLKTPASVDWFLLGIISFPQQNKFYNKASSFQEDFGCTINNVRRSRLRKTYGYFSPVSLNSGVRSFTNVRVDSTFYEYVDEPGIDSSLEHCDYDISNDSSYVWVSSGGPNSATNPDPIPFNAVLSQNTSFNGWPLWANFPPMRIETKYANLYINFSGANIQLSSSPYYWNFRLSSDGYFFILNSDGTKAMTLSNAVSGQDVTLSLFSTGTDNQKWYTTASSDGVFKCIHPKGHPELCMDIKNAQASSGTHIQVFGYNDLMRERFKTISLIHSRSIRSYYSNLYVSHVSGSMDVVQRNTEYKWNFARSFGFYYYILTQDNKYAITVQQTVDGSNLVLSEYIPGNENQLWEAHTVQGGCYIIAACSNDTMTMDIEGPSMQQNAPIQIYSFNNNYNVSQFKWILSTP